VCYPFFSGEIAYHLPFREAVVKLVRRPGLGVSFSAFISTDGEAGGLAATGGGAVVCFPSAFQVVPPSFEIRLRPLNKLGCRWPRVTPEVTILWRGYRGIVKTLHL
jgi:hypothetical protein